MAAALTDEAEISHSCVKTHRAVVVSTAVSFCGGPLGTDAARHRLPELAEEERSCGIFRRAFPEGVALIFTR